MAKAITVYARQDFIHNGRAVSAGDVLEVAPIEAASLNYRKKVTLTAPKKPLQTRELTPEPEPVKEPTPRRRRTYKRRDLRAEE